MTHRFLKPVLLAILLLSPVQQIVARNYTRTTTRDNERLVKSIGGIAAMGLSLGFMWYCHSQIEKLSNSPDAAKKIQKYRIGKYLSLVVAVGSGFYTIKQFTDLLTRWNNVSVFFLESNDQTLPHDHRWECARRDLSKDDALLKTRFKFKIINGNDEEIENHVVELPHRLGNNPKERFESFMTTVQNKITDMSCDGNEDSIREAVEAAEREVEAKRFETLWVQ